MSNFRKISLTILTFGLLFVAGHSASALTNDDIAGVYQGTSVATTSSGATITANLTITFKPTGKIKTVATVNGQTVNGKGRYQFVSEHGISESTNGGEALGFVELDGSTLTFNVLVRLDSGDVLKEITTVTLIRKL